MAKQDKAASIAEIIERAIEAWPAGAGVNFGFYIDPLLATVCHGRPELLAAAVSQILEIAAGQAGSRVRTVEATLRRESGLALRLDARCNPATSWHAAMDDAVATMAAQAQNLGGSGGIERCGDSHAAWLEIPVDRHEAPADGVSFAGLRILIGGFSPDHGRMIAQQVQSWGAETIMAGNGELEDAIVRLVISTRIDEDPAVVLINPETALPGRRPIRDLCRDLGLRLATTGGTDTARREDSSPGIPLGGTRLARLLNAATGRLREAPSFADRGVRARRALILVVDDSSINRRVIRIMLENAGYAVEEADGGRAAIAAASTGQYDLILMDLSMPSVDGFAATTAVRGLPGSRGLVPIVAFTATVLPETEMRCRAAGMHACLEKPISRSRLLPVIAQWVSGSSASDKTAGAGFDAKVNRQESPLAELAACARPERLLELVAAFCEEALTRIAGIERAAEEADFDVLRQEAHALKSSAGTFGAVQLAGFASNIEIACYRERSDSLPRLATEMRDCAAVELDQLVNLARWMAYA